MMFEGKHIHFSPLNKKPLCSYSAKLCKQRRINGYAFCIRHILEDKSAPFKQCAHVARYNKQKCTNPIPCNENREFCNSHMQVAGMLPKKERKVKKEKESLLSVEGKLKFSDRLKALFSKENSVSCSEDTFNSDDPYAFPDTVSETENGSISFSATPILRNAWNCSQKNAPEITSMDSPTRCDQGSKNSPILDTKLKNNAPTLSKTMNRLQAKIAQNKLLDKQKKTQDASHINIPLISAQLQALNSAIPLSPMEISSTNSESNETKLTSDVVSKPDVCIKIEPMEDPVRSEDSLVSNCLSSPNAPSVSQADSRSGLNSYSSSDKYYCDHEKSPTPSDLSSKDKSHFEKIKLERTDTLQNSRVPIVLRKLHRILKSRRKKTKNVFPSTIYSSESESSDSEEESVLLNQLSRFCSWDQQSSSALHSINDSRPVQQAQLKTELYRSYHQLCRLHKLYKQQEERHREILLPVVEVARAYPNQATELFLNQAKLPVKHKKIDTEASILKKTCCFKRDDDTCNNTALPYTWHCKRHIMYNVDQLLFEHCTAKFSDNTQCCVPVFDVCHELPLCFEHAKKRDNYNKMASEPKAKKPRKKPKPSALTRPPKRGKKKKKPSAIRPSSPLLPSPPPAAAALPSMIPPSTEIEMSSGNSFNAKDIKPVVAVPVSGINKDMNGELPPELGSDLEDFSPGAIDKTLELPLDTAELANQATKLLEEHDFTEVLNKIPDDAFNDLFVDTRNGDYIPTREETEELERALAAVSKDVHLARESLAKLSSSTTGPDLEELERTIEIHSSLLGADNLTSAIDENSFVDLPNNQIDPLNVISSSFSTSDLNSFTQALSAMTPENIEHNNIPPVTESSLIPNSLNLPLTSSDIPHPNLLNGHSDILTGLHPLQLDPAFANALLNSSNTVNLSAASNPTENKIFANGSVLSTMLYNIGAGQISSSTSLPQQSFVVAGSSEEGNLLSNSGNTVGVTGGISNANHWLLNASDVFALSQLAYQNGFLVTSQGSGSNFSGTLTSKYPLQDLNPEFGTLGSSVMPQTSCNTENVICVAGEQPPHISNGPASSLQVTNPVKVIVQEGAS